VSTSWSTRRRDPYTTEGIKRLRCIRCGDKAQHQWQICSDNGYFRPVCISCDVALNKLVLRFMRHPDAHSVSARYSRMTRGRQ
jgi:NAD-dependent SIR2 family protein deacetylase